MHTPSLIRVYASGVIFLSAFGSLDLCVCREDVLIKCFGS